jgi:tetratricopeptide (TPR) repeat protein
MLNLDARIDGFATQARRGARALPGRQWVDFIDLLTLRGRILGQISDHQNAVALAECHAARLPGEGWAHLARARARAAAGRFEEALVDLDAAERLGVDDCDLAGNRASVLQGAGRHDDAMALRQATLAGQASFETLRGIAVLHAGRGETAPAERLFDEAIAHFRGVSPFGLAELEFDRGRMWQELGDQTAARQWLTLAWQRLPAFTAAHSLLADVEAAMGYAESAIVRLRHLATVSGDPVYALRLARIKVAHNLHDDAEPWARPAASPRRTR